MKTLKLTSGRSAAKGHDRALPRPSLSPRSERGQALAEFALSMPILAFALFAAIEFGLMFNSQVSVVNAARNGARVAAMVGTNPDGSPISSSTLNPQVQQAVTDAANSRIDCSLSTPVVTGITNKNPNSPANQIADWTITTSCVYTPITPLAPLFAFFGGSTTATYNIQQTATMRDSHCNSPNCP